MELRRLQGEKIKSARGDMSQETLARILGVSVFTVSRYERGAVPVSDERLTQIAYALGVDKDALTVGVANRANTKEAA